MCPRFLNSALFACSHFLGLAFVVPGSWDTKKEPDIGSRDMQNKQDLGSGDTQNELNLGSGDTQNELNLGSRDTPKAAGFRKSGDTN